jgi:unsaturated rhamnogalacturonyl hydrolase
VSADRVERVLGALLAMQRHSWEQGVASHALLDLGREEVAATVAHDAVVRQRPDGRLGELDGRALVNCGALYEVVHRAAQHTGEERYTAAARHQIDWLLQGCPRAADGTLHHLADRPQVWADSLYMVVPALVLAGEVDEARRQVDGHLSRLLDPVTGLVLAQHDEVRPEAARREAWGGANGWVAAGLARAIHLRPGTDGETRGAFAGPARGVLDACLSHERADGLLHDVIDDATSFVETNAGQMLAYAALTGVADGWLPSSYAEHGRRLRNAALQHVDEGGLVQGAAGAPSFDHPGTSAEAQAFFLLAAAALAPLSAEEQPAASPPRPGTQGSAG